MRSRSLLTSIAYALTVFVMAGCVAPVRPPAKTQLEIRQFQTREYDVADTKMVMKAMLDVLQDDGFIVRNAVVDLGLITAVKEVDIEDAGEAFLSQLFGGEHASWRKNSIIEASANVSEFGRITRVRVNFQMKILDNRGGVVQVKQIDDLAYYQEFFTKVDKGIFIRRERL